MLVSQGGLEIKVLKGHQENKVFREERDPLDLMVMMAEVEILEKLEEMEHL